MSIPGIYFSDVFNVDPALLAQHGALNVCPWVDLPLFIDPFLLFASEKPELQELHKQIIEYLVYLRDHAASGKRLTPGDLKHLYCFKEVHQNCLGFTVEGTKGAGLGPKFGRSLHLNLNSILTNFGNELITETAHFEKLSLLERGVGRDKISDLTTNLIKGFLLNYTEQFAIAHIAPSRRKRVTVDKVRFDYALGVWLGEKFDLPVFNGSYILLTPEEILTKDDTWINKEEFRNDFDHIRNSISDAELRDRISAYFESALPKNFVRNKYGQLEERSPTRQERDEAVRKTLRQFPEIIDYYISQKEALSEEAVRLSSSKVEEVKGELISSIKVLVELLSTKSEFFNCEGRSLEETRRKIDWFKHVIEDQDGYKAFYHQGEPIRLEKNFQAMFKLVWEGSSFSCDAEVNNGRGPVDFKVSKGSADQTLVEFKLASNSSLRANLENQIEVYKKANRASSSFKVVIYFTAAEFTRITSIVGNLETAEKAGVILIDARADNKPSGSRAK